MIKLYELQPRSSEQHTEMIVRSTREFITTASAKVHLVSCIDQQNASVTTLAQPHASSTAEVTKWRRHRPVAHAARPDQYLPSNFCGPPAMKICQKLQPKYKSVRRREFLDMVRDATSLDKMPYSDPSKYRLLHDFPM